jgi:hypothetical protein
MKAAIIFTGSGPLLVLTTYQSLEDQKFLEKLKSKGIKKFLAYEIPIDHVRDIYGGHFKTIMNDVQQTDDLRVLDYNGHNVFYNFSFSELGNPIIHEGG